MLICLRDMLFHARHGVLDFEKAGGNTFRVSVYLTVRDTVGMESDVIADTVDYRQVYDVVSREMSQMSDLIEHVAYRIRQSLRQEFPQAEGIRVVVGKKNPPLGGMVEWAEVEVD